MKGRGHYRIHEDGCNIIFDTIYPFKIENDIKYVSRKHKRLFKKYKKIKHTSYNLCSCDFDKYKDRNKRLANAKMQLHKQMEKIKKKINVEINRRSKKINVGGQLSLNNNEGCLSVVNENEGSLSINKIDKINATLRRYFFDNKDHILDEKFQLDVINDMLDFMKKNNISKNQFAKLLKISVKKLSLIFSCDRKISKKILERYNGLILNYGKE